MTASESKGYWVYIAELSDGRLYVGITNNPHRRQIEHRLGKSIRTTRIFGFKRILHLEPCPDLDSARRREQQLKGWTRAKKLALASGDLQRLRGACAVTRSQIWLRRSSMNFSPSTRAAKRHPRRRP